MTEEILAESLTLRKVIDNFGNVHYYNKDDQRHRINGPAVIYVNGSERWYQHGKLHREDGPAIHRIDGDMYWYQHGKLHRNGGPAVIRLSGYKEWWEYGRYIRGDPG